MMKHFTSFLLFIFFSFISYTQDIPNGDLEEWQTVGGWFYNPVNWSTINSQLFESALQDSIACQENLALKVKPLPGIETTMGLAETIFPISYIPSNLAFCVKTNIVSEELFTDTCRVKISFWNQDFMFYEEVWTNTESIEEWTTVVLSLNQIEPIITDCKISVEASYPGIGLGSGSLDTWISVDDFQFEFTDSVFEQEESDFTVFPNPSSSGEFSINSKNVLGKIQLFDLLGNVVYTDFSEHNKHQVQLDVSTGIYFIQVADRIKKIIIR